MENEKIKIYLKFVGIDYWCRPIFKHTESQTYFCSLDILFSGNASKEEVKEKISSDDLVYFGSDPDCDPYGTQLNREKYEFIIDWEV